jgi:hypothetical protein
VIRTWLSLGWELGLAAEAESAAKAGLLALAESPVAITGALRAATSLIARQAWPAVISASPLLAVASQ